MDEFQKHLKEAIKNIRIADHMTYVTFPLVNEKRLLLKIFDEIYKAIVNCIYSLLYYEHLIRKLHIYENLNNDLESFFKIAKNYNVSNRQLKKINEIIELNKKHSQSVMEFVKKEKVVMMSNSLKTEFIDLITLKEYLLLAKEFLMILSKRVQR
ncbi:hypothetical protein J4221_00430 [Candidatus Pacearchaeota archaeon]|nr:hypothetical protein [Candidatus Pacearchaeota archaeon]